MKQQTQTCYIFGKKGRSKKLKRVVHDIKDDKGMIIYDGKKYPVRFIEGTENKPDCWTQDLSREIVPRYNPIYMGSNFTTEAAVFNI
ncbi:MAG TPA: hypothetical protein VIQ31_05100, partial [Phormidium sp.]